jgi:hypothetical protein
MTSRRLTLLATVFITGSALAQSTPEYRERCATRLAVNLTGHGPSAALLTSTNPQSQVDALLDSPEFVERFARFINARFNPSKADFKAQEPTYYLTKYIIESDLPWSDMFVGPVSTMRDGGAGVDPNLYVADAGMGYFTSVDWRNRYAGNEIAGYRIVTAYMLINNVLGVKMQAAVNTDGITAEGRKAAPCSGCHYDEVFGLDKIARLLTLKNGTRPDKTPQTLLGGQSISSQKMLLDTMVASPEFRFNACRLAVEFAYGRSEYKCEGPLFDQCVAAFTATGKMKSAIGTFLKDPSYCQ